MIGALAVVASAMTATSAQAASGATFYAAPDGSSSSSCGQSDPCSIERAQAVVRATPKDGDITVQLADGTYRIDSTLRFDATDGGGDHTVAWAAAPGAHPVITGAKQVSGWRQSTAGAGIWEADTPNGLDTRQLFVNGVIAPRAGIKVSSSDVAVTATGITIKSAALSDLASLPDQGRMEFESMGDFTDRYSQVDSISGSTITMKQPGWDNNTWGWDTVQSSLLAAPTWYLENSLRFLTDAGQWYISPAAGRLYYKPAPGVDPKNLDVELPELQALVSIGGTYDAPVRGLSFTGIQFSGTSWLGPSSAEGYADQQNGLFVYGPYDYRPADAFTSCARGCEMFERARTSWHQEPAAVQVSAADRISFTGNTFTDLGQSALGIGNDANATVTGVGLGASNVQVVGNRFMEDSGHGVAVGGVLPDAHHPSDPRMTNQDITIRDNTVDHVSVDYKDNGGILSTYVTRAQIVHNEVANVPYDGIDTGYGWGINDAGGSNDYVDRGYYNWNALYTTPTTLKDNRVESNLVHNTKGRFADGGTLYNLSASPGSVVDRNYLYDISGVALYLDEGSRYMTYQNNVLAGGGAWAFTNGYSLRNNTSDNVLQNNWYNSGGASTPNATQHNNQLINNVKVTRASWPADAVSVICDAGVEPQYRTSLNANLVGMSFCPTDAPVDPTFSTYSAATKSVFGQAGSAFGIAANGADVWGAGGQHDDQYGAVYRAGSFTQDASVTTRVVSVNDANVWAKSGVMVRNSISSAGAASGYAVVAVTGRNGVDFEWDANGDGYLDSSANARVDSYRPVWVRLSRLGMVYTASYSLDGTNFVQIGSPVTLASAAATQDAGMFSTSHDTTQSAVNVFDSFDLRAASVPAAPGAPTTSATSEAVTVSWAAPDNGGSPITGYRVYQEGVSDPVATTAAAVTSATVTGIWPGDTKRFSVSAVNIVGEGTRSDWASVTVPDGATQAPGKGVLSNDNGWDTGLQDGSYDVTLNLWRGEDGSIFKLYENGTLIATKQLTFGGTQPQSVSVPVTGKTNGTYVYTGELINSQGTTATTSTTVDVTQANPATPVLSQNNKDGDGSYTVTANLWWGTNATSYKFYENDVLVAQGDLAADTPNAQSAQFVATGRAVGTYTYRVDFINDAGVTSSAPITVKVTK
jgi:hypothetical protein